MVEWQTESVQCTVRMAPVESYPFAPMQMGESKARSKMYPVVGKAVGITADAVYDIVVRDNR